VAGTTEKLQLSSVDMHRQGWS